MTPAVDALLGELTTMFYWVVVPSVLIITPLKLLEPSRRRHQKSLRESTDSAWRHADVRPVSPSKESAREVPVTSFAPVGDTDSEKDGHLPTYGDLRDMLSEVRVAYANAVSFAAAAMFNGSMDMDELKSSPHLKGGGFLSLARR